ncbi:uncharacterized protein LOC142322880 [Lycorma delicatula]|uniref:uncharacterized protein LOC142322880 n=1 Tax=Lycorma delicatula TaxID=130591 RepID=UPI003F511949
MVWLPHTCFYLLLILFIMPVLMTKNIEQHLAEYNQNGFPSSILYNAIAVDGQSNDINQIDKNMLSKYLESKKIQGKAIKMALKFATDKLDGSGTVRSKMDNTTNSKMCDYSWIAWLPWFDCPQNPETEKENKIELIKEQSYKCYKSKY